MHASSYEPAQVVIERIRGFLEEHLDKWGGGDGALLGQTTVDLLRRGITSAFWASLRKNEGRSVRFRLAIIDRHGCPGALVLDRPVPLTGEHIARIAPALAEGASLGIDRAGDEIVIWGVLGVFSPLCVVLDAVQPGVVVAKLNDEGPLGSKNLAVFSFGDASFVGGDARDMTGILTHMIGERIGFRFRWYFSEALRRLTQLMHQHGHGGILLVVPSEHEAWRNGLDHPTEYAFQPPASCLQDALTTFAEAQQKQSELTNVFVMGGALQKEARIAYARSHLPALWSNVERALEIVGALTEVDGAVVIRDDLAVMGFGAKIIAPPTPLKVVTDRVVDNRRELEVDVQRLGGTRHQSAARFVSSHHDTTAIVASQDGSISIMSWTAGGLRVVQRADVLFV